MEHTIREIWDAFPYKFQGVVMGVLLMLIVMTSSKLNTLLGQPLIMLPIIIGTILYVLVKIDRWVTR